MIKSVIIDNEQSAQETLSKLLEIHCKEVRLLGTADGVKSGLELINKHQPDLVFLDIQMGPDTGFDLLQRLLKVNFAVIFTTSYDQYALKAIKFNALDYLLKPIVPEELILAVTKIKISKDYGNQNLRVANFIDHLTNNKVSKIILPTSGGFTLIEIEEIIRCEADRNYTNIYLKNGSKILCSQTLKHFDDLLIDHNFFRSHHSHLVNTNYIVNYMRQKDSQIKLSDGTIIPISKNKRGEFLKIFS